MKKPTITTIYPRANTKPLRQKLSKQVTAGFVDPDKITLYGSYAKGKGVEQSGNQ